VGVVVYGGEGVDALGSGLSDFVYVFVVCAFVDCSASADVVAPSPSAGVQGQVECYLEGSVFSSQVLYLALYFDVSLPGDVGECEVQVVCLCFLGYGAVRVPGEGAVGVDGWAEELFYFYIVEPEGAAAFPDVSVNVEVSCVSSGFEDYLFLFPFAVFKAKVCLFYPFFVFVKFHHPYRRSVSFAVVDFAPG